jgi:uncharacterized protein (TIGR02646 family)
VVYTLEENGYLNSLKPFQTNTWDSISTIEINQIKLHIKNHLNQIQVKKCAYCGLTLYETSDPEIEHIAPKGKRGNRTLYPQFSFTEQNLVLACHRCNCSRKRTYDSVVVCNSNYTDCIFKIVHPYFDDPIEHFDWADDDTKVVITGKSIKGNESITLFGLDSEEHSIARAKQIVFEHLSQEDEALIKRILDYKLNNH